MHRLASELGVHPVREERRKWRQKAARHYQHFAERSERSTIVIAVHVIVPRAREPHIPVGYVVDEELHDETRCCCRIECCERSVCLALDCCKTCLLYTSPSPRDS